jgi:hypothetical protein
MNMRFLAVVKALLILAFLASGVLLLLVGFNVDIPLIKFKGLEASGVPVGVVLIVIGVALAYFWKIKVTHKIEETYSPVNGSGFKYTRVQTTDSWAAGEPRTKRGPLPPSGPTDA